ncbi:MAG TPA: transporter substrate-binding domain-containing protein [Candidatus Limnocylindria bacterium]|nr:transporter substrate-binding domain-containing protein [Candidatus Limnocylindria bacterium]
MRLTAALMVLASLVVASCGGAPASGGAPAVSTSPPRAIAPTATASPTPAPIAFPADIAATGRLRVALSSSDQAVISKDPVTGELKGAVVDVARELARRSNLSFVPVEYATFTKMVELMKAGSWDVGIISIDPAREAEFDFAPPFLDVDFGYLVRPGATIKNAADVDQPGVRVIVRRGTQPDATLSASLKRAQLVRFDGLQDAAFDELRAGNGDVLALARPALLVYAEKLPGSAVLADRFGLSQFALAVPKGKADRLRPVRQFSDELRTGDFVKQAIARSGPKGTQPTVP